MPNIKRISSVSSLSSITEPLSHTSSSILSYKDKYLEEVVPDLGYIAGYKDSANEDQELAEVNTSPKNEYLSKINDEFINEIHREQRGEAIFSEDPLFLDFKILFIKNSPLFKIGNDTDTSNTASKFLKKYSNIPEVKKRINMHKQFIEMFNEIFDYDKDNNSTHYKNYLIENISGIENFNKKIFNPDQDKISITLSENVSMSMLYLSELYNNLVYDYNGVREILPDNCLRFNMYIKLQDMRTFKTIDKNNKSNPFKVDEKQSHIIYVLNDCILDFSNSQNAEGSMTINGFETALNTTTSKLTFDIYYKSIKRVMNPMNIKNGIYLDSKNIFSKIDDYDREYGSIYNENKDEFQHKDNMLQGKMRKLGKQSTLGNVLKKSKLADRLKGIVKKEIDKVKDDLISKFKELRGKLINDILYDIREKAHIPPKIYPTNVYDSDFHKLSLGNFLKSLESNLYTEVEDTLREGVNDFFTNLGL